MIVQRRIIFTLIAITYCSISVLLGAVLKGDGTIYYSENPVTNQPIALVSSQDSLPPPPPTPPRFVPLPLASSDSLLIFKVTEDMPTYGDCGELKEKRERYRCSGRNLIQFIRTTIDYSAIEQPVEVDNPVAFITFIVERDGSMTDLKVDKDPGQGMGDEALRVVQIMATEGEGWNPGLINGQPVRTLFKLPIKFELE